MSEPDSKRNQRYVGHTFFVEIKGHRRMCIVDDVHDDYALVTPTNGKSQWVPIKALSTT